MLMVTSAAEFLCQFEASGGAAYNDDLGRSHLFGAEEGYEADGAATLDDDGIAQLHFAAHGGVDADGVGFGQHGDLGRAVGFEYAGIFEAQVDIVGESAVEVGGNVGGIVEAVGTVAACARGEDDAVAFLQGTADVVFGTAGADGLDNANIFVAHDQFALYAVLPVVQVRSADTGQFLAQEHFARFRVVHGIFADFEILSLDDDRPTNFCHGFSSCGW